MRARAGHEEIALNLDASTRQSRARAGRRAPSVNRASAADAVGGRLRTRLRARLRRPRMSRLRLDARRHRAARRSAQLRRASICASATSICRDRYATIGDASRFTPRSPASRSKAGKTSIAGLRAGARARRSAQAGQPARSQRDRRPLRRTCSSGFSTSELAAHIAPLIDAGARYRARVDVAHRGRVDRRVEHRGVNIVVEREASACSCADGRATQRRGADRRDDGASQASAVRAALIGDAAAARRAAQPFSSASSREATRWRCSEPGAGSRSAFSIRPRCARSSGGGKTLVVYPLARARQRSVRSADRAGSNRSGCASFAPTARSTATSARSCWPRCARARGTSCSRRRSSSSSIARRSRGAEHAVVRRSSTKRITCMSRGTARPTRALARRSRHSAIRRCSR